jgi:hypothetical protein
MFHTINVANIKVKLVADERPNETEAHENDEGNKDTYSDNDENNFFNSSKKCTTYRSIMILLSNTWSYMLIYEGQILSHVKFHLSCSNLRRMTLNFLWSNTNNLDVQTILNDFKNGIF